jgi:aspartate aminotransferase-like enzyme
MTYRLRLPGPTDVPRQVREALARPVVNHRGNEYHAMHQEAVRLVKPLFGTAGDVLLFPGSGTAGMEAALVNAVAPGERVLAVSQGQFGERFQAIAESMGARVDRLDCEWGTAPDPDTIAARLRHANYRAVMLTHNESATGAVADLERIGPIVARHDALLIVDAVSSLGGIPVEQDAWGLDIVVTASQKALMCPPGMTLIGVSEKAWRVANRDDRAARFFWDFRRARAAAEKGETSFTAPVTLVNGLLEALRMITAEGRTAVFARHHRLASALRAGGKGLGLSLFTRAPILSDTVTVFDVPKGLDGSAIVRHMYERYGTVIAGARNRMQGKVIRIGTMGTVSDSDIMTDLLHLELTLRHFGIPVAPGAGVAAAAHSLAADARVPAHA